MSLAQRANELSGVYFLVAMLGLIAIFIISHWASLLSQYCSSRGKGRFVKVTRHLSRIIHGALLQKVPFCPSLGYSLLFVVYLGFNVMLCFYDLDWTSLPPIARRFGWMAVYNMVLITFLALKNTPLAFLTGYSYERLNGLHRMAGYCAVIFSLLHTIVCTTALSYEGRLSYILEFANIMGLVAGFAILFILVSALILRKRAYELFYVLHISLFIVLLIATAMHRPDITLNTLVIVIFTASIWICDRIIRLARLSWYSFGNYASIIPVAHGGVRLILGRTPPHAVPGSHVFLWLPKIRALETHPFTIVSTHPLELVVSAHNGFTKDLLAYASKHPHAHLKASIDGPYGTVPNFTAFDQIILVAGGSGAIFTFGIATELINKLRNSVRWPIVHFIWVVRDADILTSYAKELEIIHASSLVQLTIHATGSTPRPSSTTSQTTTRCNSITSDMHKPSYEKEFDYSHDIEKFSYPSPDQSVSFHSGPEIRTGRPDIGKMIPYLVNSVESDKRTIVAACGPENLMLASRAAVAGIVGAGRRSVTLHCEQFGW